MGAIFFSLERKNFMSVATTGSEFFIRSPFHATTRLPEETWTRYKSLVQSGKDAMRMKLYLPALRHFESALQLNSSSLFAIEGKAECLVRLDRIGEAATFLTPLLPDIDMSKSPSAWKSMGVVHFREGNYSRAAKIFGDLFNGNPRASFVFAYFWDSLNHLGRYSEAESACKLFLSTSPADEISVASANLKLAFTLAKLDRRGEGDIVFDKVSFPLLESSMNERLIDSAVSCIDELYAQGSNRKKAIASLKSLLEFSPNNLFARRLIASLFVDIAASRREGAPEDAQKFLGGSKIHLAKIIGTKGIPGIAPLDLSSRITYARLILLGEDPDIDRAVNIVMKAIDEPTQKTLSALSISLRGALRKHHAFDDGFGYFLAAAGKNPTRETFEALVRVSLSAIRDKIEGSKELMEGEVLEEVA